MYTDEAAEIGVDLSDKHSVHQVENVNHELIDPDAKAEIATVEPVPGKMTTVI